MDFLSADGGSKSQASRRLRAPIGCTLLRMAASGSSNHRARAARAAERRGLLFVRASQRLVARPHLAWPLASVPSSDYLMVWLHKCHRRQIESHLTASCCALSLPASEHGCRTNRHRSDFGLPLAPYIAWANRRRLDIPAYSPIAVACSSTQTALFSLLQPGA